MKPGNWTVEELVNSISLKQIKDVVDWVSAELKTELGKDIDFGEIVGSYIRDIAKRENLPAFSYLWEPPAARTPEEIAIESLWRAQCYMVAPEEAQVEGPLIRWMSRPVWPPADLHVKPKKPPVQVNVVEELPRENLEALKELVKRAALRKLKEMEDTEKIEKNGA